MICLIRVGIRMKRFVEGADRRPARLEFWLVVALGGYDEPINRSGQRKEDGPGYSLQSRPHEITTKAAIFRHR